MDTVTMKVAVTIAFVVVLQEQQYHQGSSCSFLRNILRNYSPIQEWASVQVCDVDDDATIEELYFYKLMLRFTYIIDIYLQIDINSQTEGYKDDCDMWWWQLQETLHAATLLTVSPFHFF